MQGSAGTIQLKCAGCGAPIGVPGGADVFACGYCGAQLRVERKDGAVWLEKAVAVIERIREGTDRAAAELALRRLTEQRASLLQHAAEAERHLSMEGQQLEEARAEAEKSKMTSWVPLPIAGALMLVAAILHNGFSVLFVLLAGGAVWAFVAAKNSAAQQEKDYLWKRQMFDGNRAEIAATPQRIAEIDAEIARQRVALG